MVIEPDFLMSLASSTSQVPTLFTCNRIDIVNKVPLREVNIQFNNNKPNKIFGCFAIVGLDFMRLMPITHDMEEQWLLYNLLRIPCLHYDHFTGIGISHYDMNNTCTKKIMRLF